MNQYQKYLQNKHDQLTTNPEVIESVVLNATGQTVTDKVRLVVGEQNEVYFIKLQSHQEVVLRIAHAVQRQFHQEQWAIEKCLESNLRVPKIFSIQHQKTKDGFLSFCIMEKINGQPLLALRDNYDAIDRRYLKKMIVKAGAILTKIHQIPTRGFGRIDSQGQGEYKNFEEMMLEKVDQRRYLLKLSAETSFNPQKMEKILEIISAHASLYEADNSILNHGDFGPKHIMVEGDSITGILDWGETLGHLPVYDFAYWDYWRGDKIPTEWLKEGYDNKAIFDKDFDTVTHLIKLHLGIGLLYHYHQDSYLPNVELVKRNFDRDLAYFT